MFPFESPISSPISSAYRVSSALSEVSGFSEEPLGSRHSLPPPESRLPSRASSPDSLADPFPAQSVNFWFDDGNLVIKVDQTLYNVYKGLFYRHSGIFRSHIDSDPKSPLSSNAEKNRTRHSVIGSTLLGSPDRPLVLNVSKSDFELLLSYLFPEDYTAQYNLSVTEWIDIADVSTELELKSVRAAAITNIIEKANAIEVIQFGRKRGISECYLKGVRSLAWRETLLSFEEQEELGIETVVVITLVRGMLAKGLYWSDIENMIQLGSAK